MRSWLDIAELVGEYIYEIDSWFVDHNENLLL